jgi:chlorobactene glucosyltransferase
VIVPARNEARNIVPCVSSILATTYPQLELIVVDDHSTDGTGDLARQTIGSDSRARVITPPPLPADWFGKQWACAAGAGEASGEILLFTDADTRHAPELLVRAVNALRARRTDLLSVVGRQETGSFWEHLIQPQVFGMLASRYGNTEWIERSPFVHDKIANGQCFLMTRNAYEAVGGHASVRHNVAEDLLLAQHVFRAGRKVSAVIGSDYLVTRMYTSLGELLRGWGKNLYAGGRYATPGGRVGRALYPFLLVPSSGLLLLPFLIILLAATGSIHRSWIVDGIIAWLIVSAWGALVQWWSRGRPLLAPLYPLGTLVFMYITASAVLRGRNVEWKGRRYVSS